MGADRVEEGQRAAARADDEAEVAVELGDVAGDPAEKISIFRIPGAWEEEGFKILERYGVRYADRSTSLHEAARLAVAAEA